MKLIQRAAALALAAVLSAAVLTGCGGTPSSSSKPTSTSGKPASSASSGSGSTAKEEEKPVAAHTISYNDSKVKKYFISVTKSQNFYIDLEDSSGRLAFAKKGDKFYEKIRMDDESYTFFYDGTNVYVTEMKDNSVTLTEKDKTAVYISDEESKQEFVSDFVGTDLVKEFGEGESDLAKATITAESKATAEGFRYIETVKESDGSTTIFYFKGNDLVKIGGTSGTTAETAAYTVHAWTVNVPDSLFKVPAGYTVKSFEDYVANN